MLSSCGNNSTKILKYLQLLQSYVIIVLFYSVKRWALGQGKEQKKFQTVLPQPATLLKKTLAQVFSSEYCKIFKNKVFFYRIPMLASSGFPGKHTGKYWNKTI